MTGGIEVKRGRVAKLGLAGPLAAALFLAGLVGFALLRTDGYSHGTKAVSELGAVDAPSAAAFNLLAFILPGLLVSILALGLARGMGQRAVAGPLLLALSGWAMVLAGVFPVDMADQASPVSIMHYAGAMLTGLFWALSLFWLQGPLRRRPGLTTLGRLTPWFAIFVLANVLWQIAYQSGVGVLPGWGQRIGFLGYFLWVTLAGLALWSNGASAAPGDDPEAAGARVEGRGR